MNCPFHERLCTCEVVEPGCGMIHEGAVCEEHANGQHVGWDEGTVSWPVEGWKRPPRAPTSTETLLSRAADLLRALSNDGAAFRALPASVSPEAAGEIESARDLVEEVYRHLEDVQ